MKCKKCGREFDGIVDACSNCGEKIYSVKKIKEIDDSACLNRLMALEGAIQNIRWHDLSENDKKNLKDFYNLHKQN